jgi:hypothetical protein
VTSETRDIFGVRSGIASGSVGQTTVRVYCDKYVTIGTVGGNTNGVLLHIVDNKRSAAVHYVTSSTTGPDGARRVHLLAFGA